MTWPGVSAFVKIGLTAETTCGWSADKSVMFSPQFYCMLMREMACLLRLTE